MDLIIPALNEEATLPRLLAELPRAGLRHVILADNGSTDRTARCAAAGGAQVVHEPMRGYGAACLAAMRWIDDHPPPPEVVGFLDADLADDPAQLPRLLAPIERGEADLVIGSRPRLADAGALNATQRFGNRLACTMLNGLTGAAFTDLGPMRLIRWDCLQGLAMADRTWGWTIEMQYKAVRRGLRCLELDVPYRRRYAGRSKISGSLTGATRAAVRIVATVARLWWEQPGRP